MSRAFNRWTYRPLRKPVRARRQRVRATTRVVRMPVTVTLDYINPKHLRMFMGLDA